MVWLQSAAKRLRQGCCTRRVPRGASQTECKALVQAAAKVDECSQGLECEPALEQCGQVLKSCDEQAPELALSSTHFADLSEEVYGTTLLYLQGCEAAGIAAVSKRVGRQLSEGKLWPAFVRQEFPCAAASGEVGLGLGRYVALLRRQRCRQIEWRRVPARHGLGGREARPHCFHWRGHAFFFGGWEGGDYDFDLHAGPLAVPLVLRGVRIEGQAPKSTYCGSITLLEDALEDAPEDACLDGKGGHLRVLVFGGYIFNGYHQESAMFGIFEITMQEDGELSARWQHIGALTALSNHTCTYVPPRLSGEQYPKGYAVVVGGIQGGMTVGDVGVLDLSTFAWTPSIAMTGALAPRNSHSATLMRRADGSYGVLVVGGGSGDGTNGNPPRGGRDYPDSDWIVGLENAALQWAGASVLDNLVPGRGHIACRLQGTGTLLTLCGGQRPTAGAASFSAGEVRAVEVTGEVSAPARAFGCGCALPDGTALVYGGYSSRLMTHGGDIWALRVVGAESDFFDKLPTEAAAQAPDLEEADRALPMRSLDVAMLRALLAARRRMLESDDEGEEGEEDEDDEVEPEGQEEEPEADVSSSSDVSPSAANALASELERDLED